MNDDLDVRAIRRHFAFPGTGRVMADNAASTQAPRELTGLCRSLAQAAPAGLTALFRESLGTIAAFIGAPSQSRLALYRNTTEAINAVMYSLLTEFRDGDNMVVTMLEHDSTTPAEVDRAVAAIAAGPGAAGHPRVRRPALTARPAP
jgi:cysteine desulfurase/selenocysteine lyase